MDRDTRRRVVRFLDDYDHGRVDPSIQLPDFVRAIVNEAIDSVPAALACDWPDCENEATWMSGNERFCDTHPEDWEQWQARFLRLRSNVEGCLQHVTMQEFRAALLDALDSDLVKD